MSSSLQAFFFLLTKHFVVHTIVVNSKTGHREVAPSFSFVIDTLSFFFSDLDDEFHTFRWEDYLKSTGTIAAPSHFFKTVSLIGTMP